ncbi:MAG: hypothetical protein WD556_02640 [Actinomycetota bacterium]
MSPKEPSPIQKNPRSSRRVPTWLVLAACGGVLIALPALGFLIDAGAITPRLVEPQRDVVERADPAPTVEPKPLTAAELKAKRERRERREEREREQRQERRKQRERRKDRQDEGQSDILWATNPCGWFRNLVHEIQFGSPTNRYTLNEMIRIDREARHGGVQEVENATGDALDAALIGNASAVNRALGRLHRVCKSYGL